MYHIIECHGKQRKLVKVLRLYHQYSKVVVAQMPINQQARNSKYSQLPHRKQQVVSLWPVDSKV